MTATFAATESTVDWPFPTPRNDRLPQTPDAAPGRSIWTRLQDDFANLSRTRAAAAEYGKWRALHGWEAATATEVVPGLRDDARGLGTIVAAYQSGSKLAAALLVEAFRPALITFSRYARIDICEQVDRSELRAQRVLATFYQVASTTDPDSTSIAARLYGETLKRVTRETGVEVNWSDTALPVGEFWDCRLYELEQHQPHDVAPVCAHSMIDWEAVELRGLVRDLIETARDKGAITRLDADLITARFLTGTLVPVPTLARTFDLPLSQCETRIRRAQAKLRTFFAPETSSETAAA